MTIQTQQQHSRRDSSGQDSPYPRRDYFGNDEDSDSLGGVRQSYPGTAKAEWMAKLLLKEGATFLDPVALEDGASVVLSDPEFYVRESPGQQMTAYGLYRRRVSESSGRLVSGGTIQDRPMGEFLGIVEDWLGELERRGEVRDSERGELVARAKELKHDDELHDVQILRRLIREVQRNE